MRGQGGCVRAQPQRVAAKGVVCPSSPMAGHKGGVVYSVYIVNKSGGLIFFRTYGELTPKMNSNDALRLAGMWHGLSNISAQLSPVPTEGPGNISLLETDNFDLHCLLTATGLKFFLTAQPRAAGMEALLWTIYQLYGDFVMKDPFYENDMPIRSGEFDKQLTKAVK